MPTVQTAPPRILVAPRVVVLTRESDAVENIGGHATEYFVEAAVDLEYIRSVREVIASGGESQDADGAQIGEIVPSRCALDDDGDGFLLVARYADVLSAWLAYRTHADALGRLRN